MSEKECYAFKHSSEDIRRSSTSGGAFSALAEMVLEQGGVVFGASLMPNMSVDHRMIDIFEDLALLRGSKYLQSNTGNTFQQAKKELASGRFVLFAGTPCQISGLKRYLGEYADSDYLLTCDIICHGVSSPMIWREYVKYKENIYGGKVTAACFRDKFGYGWSSCKETITVCSEKFASDDYTKIFYDHEAMRPSCYHCCFTNLDRIGDLTLGDFWGVDTAHPEIYDEIGVSLILVNSKKGRILLNGIGTKGKITPAKVSETRQPQLYKPVKEPATRPWFWRIYYSKGIEGVIKANSSVSGISLVRNLIHNSKTIAKQILCKIRGSE